MKKILLLTFLVFILVSSQNPAQVKESDQSPDQINSIPSKISYQGVLTDNNGIPQNGTYTMDFELFPTQSGGTAVWSETQQNVPVTNGLFNVYLGQNNPLNGIAFDVPYWLQVTVSGEVLSRIELSSSAYSFNTSRIQGKQVSDIPPTGGEVLKWNSSNLWWEPAPDNTGGGSFWNLTGNDLYYDGGRVLVGTTTSLGDIGFQSDNPFADGVAIAGYDYTGSSGGTGVFGYSNSFAAIQGNGNNAQYGGYFMGKVYIGGKTLIGTLNSSGNIGLESDNPFPNGAAIAGYDYQNSSGAGIFGYSNGFTAIHGNGTDAYYAGYFDGDVHINGTLSKSGGSFEIDDPRDPSNRILRHSFVESPDMMNVYNGNVITDGTGNAVVTLPDYFNTINKDYRYQLTVIGQFAQAIISEEIQGNQFSIKTDKPNIKVSWQVTGIRKDPWAEKHRIVVEEEKMNDIRGYYFNPDAYGLPYSRSISWVKQPNLMKSISRKSER